jgi:hypothetical protein
MNFNEQISSILLLSRKHPIPANEVLCKLLENEIHESKGWFTWLSDFTHINVTYLIIRETKKEIQVTEMMQNIINNILSGIPINERLASLFRNFFIYYPCFIELLPTSLSNLKPSNPYHFPRPENLIPDMKTCKSIEKNCPRTQEQSISLCSESLSEYISRIVTDIVDNKSERTTFHALKAFNAFAPRISYGRASDYLKRLLKLVGNNLFSSHNDELITAINHLANNIKSLQKSEQIEKILQLTFQYKRSDITSCLQQLLTYYPTTEKPALLVKARANLLSTDMLTKHFGLQMLGLLCPAEIKLSDINHEDDLEKKIIVIDIFTTRLSACNEEEIASLLSLALNCLSSNDLRMKTRTCAALTNLCNYLSAAQINQLIETLVEEASTCNDVILISALHTTLAVLKKSNDRPVILKSIKLMEKAIFHLHPDLYEPAHHIFYAVVKAKAINLDLMLPICMDKVREGNAAAAELLVEIKDLLNVSQQRLVANRSLEIYNALATDESKIPAARVLGQYNRYIENLNTRKITLRLYDIVYDTYCSNPKYNSLNQNQNAITLLENLSDLVDDTTRFYLLQFLCCKVNDPYVKRLLVALIEDIHDEEDNHYFLGFVAIAKSHDNFHLYNDDRDVEVNSLSLERLILNIYYEKPARPHQPVLAINRASAS